MCSSAHCYHYSKHGLSEEDIHMINPKKDDIDLETSVEIADGVYWVGFYDEQAGLHCNPYLIIDNDEAMVIDGGSRPDFATVMMKILQTGIAPNKICALLYQHYDPDLCGSIPNFEDIIKRDDLRIISDSANLMFIRHYSVNTRLLPISKINYQYTFSSGRTLYFTRTPYTHSGGSFVTFDAKSGVLFTSDLFGSLGLEWELFLDLQPECMDCTHLEQCPQKRKNCPINDILNFHKTVMPSGKALRYSLEQVLDIPFTMIAPQHGSIITDKETLRYVFELLSTLEGVGIDGVVGDDYVFNSDHLRQRFKQDEI